MPLDKLTRYWRGKEENSTIDMAEHIKVMRANMELVREVAYHKETKEKVSQKTQHDKKAVESVFNVEDFVLVFRPRKLNKLMSEWKGPFIITRNVTEVTYKVDTGTAGKQFKMFHVNAMKQWTSPGPAVFLLLEYEEDLEDDLSTSEQEAKQNNSFSPDQTHQLNDMKVNFSDVIQDTPGRTTLVYYDIPTEDAL